MTARLPTNLMLVEDERIVAFDLKRQLSGFGYRVGAVVASGEQAISQVAEAMPDLVLMDIHLEGSMDGIQAAAEIRARHKIPVVFLTAYAEDDTLSRALDSRPFGYLVKPCEGRELHATIQMALARREDELLIEESEQRLKLALDAASLGVLEWSPESNRLQGDAHFSMLFDNSAQPFDEPWETFIARVAPASREVVRAALDSTMLRAEAVHISFCTVGNGSPPRYMEAHAKAYGGTDAGGRVVGVFQDVTERRKNEERLRQSSVVFQTIAEAIVITDAARRIVAVNGAFSRITGFGEAEVVGRNPDEVLRITADAECAASDLANGRADFWQGEIRLHRKDGEPFPAWQSISVVRDASGAATHFVTAFSDVSAIYEAQRKLDHLAHHDALTGLPNRLLFDDRLKTSIEHALRNSQRCLLLFLDLDGFKVINDTLGHAVGDELLRTVSERLKNVLRTSDTIARLGGDEFVILAGANPDYAAQLAQKILDQLRIPIPLSGSEPPVSISGSIGIAVFPENGTNDQELMRAADMAMYTAKAEGRNRFHFFSDDMSERAGERMRVEQGLRRALVTESLAVHYQPRVMLTDHRIVGVEALVRWPDPEHGLVLPANLITIAEESGVIELLGRWVLRRACREMLQLVGTNGSTPRLHLAVNVSPRQFLGNNFVTIVKAAIEETGFPASALELEITESTLQATERSLPILKALKDLGVAISIDDFGTGYSSLSVLRDLPIDRVKIDRSFIVEMPASGDQRAIVEAIVAMSRAMHISTTVEGIETRGQADLLRELGCEEGQGFLFGRPMSFADLAKRLEEGRPAAE